MSLGNIFLLTNNQQRKKVHEFIIERIANSKNPRGVKSESE